MANHATIKLGDYTKCRPKNILTFRLHRGAIRGRMHHMSKKTTTKIRRKVYRGWIDTKDASELPPKVTERTKIVFGSYRWNEDNPHEKRVKITVEWKA